MKMQNANIKIVDAIYIYQNAKLRCTTNLEASKFVV